MTSAPQGPRVEEVLRRWAARPEVVDAVERAREACARLRWHAVLRRRADEARAEAVVRAAWASAALEGAALRLDEVRAEVAAWVANDAASARDPISATARGAVRATALAHRLAADWQTSRRPPPIAQALARLHTVAARDLASEEDLGRPRSPDPTLINRLRGLDAVFAAPADVPAAVVAAVVQAEVESLAPFSVASGMVARAAARAVLIVRGLDPTGGVVVWEGGLLAAGPEARAALEAYRSGGWEGMTPWPCLWAEAVVDGCGIAVEVCDDVLRGRLPGASG